MTLRLKHLILIFLTWTCSAPVFAQQKPTLEVLSSGTVKEPAAFLLILSKADFTRYRLPAQRRIIEFDDGARVNLYSRNELSSLYGLIIDETVPVYFDGELIYPRKFSVSPTGHIIEQIPVENKK